MGQITAFQESKPFISRFLKLRVHHLSYFLINLWQSYGNPSKIEIKFNMENYVDTPSSKSPKAVMFDDLTLEKINEKVHVTRTNEFVFQKTRNENTQATICSHSIFDSAFKQLDENIIKILDINKVIKQLKKSKKAGVEIDKHHYKSLLKGYEKEKSEAKRNIRNVIISLYS